MGLFGWLKRLFRIGNAEANSLIDKLEDPTKLAEQGVRELKEDYQKSLKSLAEVKALAIRTRNEYEAKRVTATEYEKKAILLLKKAQMGEITQEDADRLAAQALDKKQQLLVQIEQGGKNLSNYEAMVAKMEVNTQKVKEQITNWEGEVKTLKARHKISEATERLNRQLANVDSSDTLAMLERMKEKVTEQEALAESYGQMADNNVSLDDEINKVLKGSGNPNVSAELSKIKAQLSQESTKVDGSTTLTEGSGSSSVPTSELDKLKQILENDDNSKEA